MRGLFVREWDKTYMQYDEIRFSQQQQGEVTIEFFWRGELAYTMRTDCALSAGQTLHLIGVDGRMEFKHNS